MAMSNLLVHLFGWPATLIHGDAMVLDRWRFLRQRLPRTRSTGEQVLDVGCGTGAFTMGLALLGYETVGLSWNERNQEVAARRAAILRIENVSFPVCDIRRLHECEEFLDRFDAIVCLENIEHIIDDLKLSNDMFRCLKPGGRLYLTSPNYHYNPLSKEDMGPFSFIEDGGHVRRGYTPCMLRELCAQAGFKVEEITYVSHVFSQLTTRLSRFLSKIAGARLAWIAILPLRPLAPLFDDWVGKWIGQMIGWPGYSIALVAYKNRFG